MNKYWITLLALTVSMVLLVFMLPDTIQGQVVHKKWAYLEVALLSIVSLLLWWYNSQLVTQDDAYFRLQSVYISTFSKFLIAAGVIAAYVLSDRSSFTRATLFVLMGVYLVYLIFISIMSIKNTASHGT